MESLTARWASIWGAMPGAMFIGVGIGRGALVGGPPAAEPLLEGGPIFMGALAVLGGPAALGGGGVALFA